MQQGRQGLRADASVGGDSHQAAEQARTVTRRSQQEMEAGKQRVSKLKLKLKPSERAARPAVRFVCHAAGGSKQQDRTSLTVHSAWESNLNAAPFHVSILTHSRYPESVFSAHRTGRTAHLCTNHPLCTIHPPIATLAHPLNHAPTHQLKDPPTHACRPRPTPTPTHMQAWIHPQLDPPTNRPTHPSNQHHSPCQPYWGRTCGR